MEEEEEEEEMVTRGRYESMKEDMKDRCVCYKLASEQSLHMDTTLLTLSTYHNRPTYPPTIY